MIPNANGQSGRDKVLELTDLVALIGESVALRPKGREHVGLCPFHEDHKPSFAVVTHKGNAFYNCFSCGASGNAIDFMMNFHRMEFLEALRFLAQRAGVELPSSREPRADPDAADSPSSLRRANDAALRFFRRSLADSTLGADVAAAFATRGIDSAMIERFALGAAPASGQGLLNYVEKLVANQSGAADERVDGATIRGSFEAAGLLRRRSGALADGFRNRAIFPICDELGRCIAFGARSIVAGDDPKYLNSPESAIFHKSKSLYGIHLAKRAIIRSRTAIVTEGYTDVIACHSAGFENVVATLGTALTADHARILERLCDTIVLLFDGDIAGQRAADRALEIFFRSSVDLKVCTLPEGKDPDELLREPEGKAAFEAAIADAPDALAHLVASFARELAARPGLSARQRTVEAMLAKLASLGFATLTGIRRTLVLEAIAKESGIAASELERTINATKRPADRSEPAASTTTPPPATKRGKVERDFLSILIAWPSTALGRVADVHGELAPLTELIAPTALEDDAARAIYTVFFDSVESGRASRGSLTMQELLAELGDASQKSLAAELFSLGSTRFADEAQALEGLATAALALERMQQRARLASAPRPTTPEEMDQRLEQLRAAGPRPSAIARTARSAT